MTGSPHEREKLTAPQDLEPEYHTSKGSDIDDSDQPRVAQWIDEGDLDEDQSDDETPSETYSSSGVDIEDNYKNLEKDLSKLPLGAIVKARKAIEKTTKSPSISSEESSDDLSDFDSEASDDNAKKTQKSSSKETHHRSSKHAPQELSSKRPVSRRRQVVEVHRIKVRDPRFSDLSGSLNIARHQSQYGFLRDMHKEELSTLKESLARARKLLANSPRHLREDRETEVQRLEGAVKRTESIVNREKQQAAELETLRKVKREERDKQKAGKKAWWLKKSDEKAIRLRARLDDLAESGGKRAVKKAIEKKQRKVGQKEKKSRPFAPPPRPQLSEGIKDVNGLKRRREADNHEHYSNGKRPRHVAQ